MDNMKTIYTPKEIKSILNIAEVTLRKWAMALESSGYSFNRNNKDHRIFYDSDLILLKQFQTLVQSQNMSLNEAAHRTLLIYANELNLSSKQDEQKVSVEILEDYKDKINSLTKQLNEQQVFHKNILNKLTHLEYSIDERLNMIEKRQNEQAVIISEGLAAFKEVKQLLEEERESKTSNKFRKFF